MNRRKRADGGITVFLALVTVLIASLLLSVVESARTQAAETYLVLAADSAVDSLFSQYHRELWEEYRLLGLEMYSMEEVTDEFEGFLEPYFDETKVRNFCRLSLPENSTALKEYTLLTDNGAAVFEEEILDYMRYGIAASVTGVAEMEETVTGLKEASESSEAVESMQEYAEKMTGFERKLAKLKSEVEKAEKKREGLGEAVAAYSYPRYSMMSGGLEAALRSVIRQAESLKNEASRLQTEFEKTGAETEAKKAAGKISEETCSLILTELSELEACLSEQGKYLLEAETLKQTAEENLPLLEEADREAAAAEAYAAAWTPTETIVGYAPPAKEGGEPVPIIVTDELDLEEVWSDTAAAFTALKTLSFSYTEKEKDTGLKKTLEGIQDLLNGGLLQLVCPYADQISSEKKDMTENPSGVFSAGERETDAEALLKRLFVDEYVLTEFSSLRSGRDGETSGNGSAAQGKTGQGKAETLYAAETEYILYGKESDRENIAALAGEFMTIRTAANLLHILKDSVKRREAEALAAKIGGAAGGAPLTAVIAFLVMSVWAAAQAALDVRDLLAGGKVPLMHTKASFYLTAEQLITDFSGTFSGSHTSETGLDYRGWLRILLYLHMGPEAEYRMMDVIQWNLRKTQPDFLMRRIYTAASLEATAQSRNLFTVIFGSAAEEKYTLTAETYYSY